MMTQLQIVLLVVFASIHVFALTETQTQALIEIKTQDHYSVEVVKMDLDGKEVKIVLFGERGHFPETLPQAAKDVIEAFPVRVVENAGSFEELHRTYRSFDEDHPQILSLRAQRLQDGVKGSEKYNYNNSIVPYATKRGLFLSSQNELLYNYRRIGLLDADGIAWDGSSLKEIMRIYSPSQFFPFVNSWKDRLISARKPIEPWLRYEMDLSYGLGPVLYQPEDVQDLTTDLVRQVNIGAEFGFGFKWQHWFHQQRGEEVITDITKPELRDYLMTENLLAVLMALNPSSSIWPDWLSDTEVAEPISTVLFIGATTHTRRVANLLRNKDFVQEVLEKQK